MRWVVYLLLAGNLGLLTWNLLREPAPASGAAAPMPAPSAAERDMLPLLAELDTDELRARPGSRATSPPTTVPAPEREPETPAASPDAAPTVASAVPSTPTPPSPAPPSAEPESATPASPEPASEPSAPTDVASAPDTPAPATAGDPAPADAAPSPPMCMTLGPLTERETTPRIQAWLEAKGADADTRTAERREVALYWVYFPPRESRQQAIREVETMKSQGINDVIVVPKGDMANAISLGVYSRPESRDRRLKELNGKGYEPSIGPRYRTTVADWIDLTAPAGGVDRAAIEARWPGVRVTATPCPDPPVAGVTVSATTDAAAPVPDAAPAPDTASVPAAPGTAESGPFFSGRTEQ